MSILPKKQLDKAIKYWWVQLINGLLFIGFSLSVIKVPDDSFFTLSTTFSVLCIVTGITQLLFIFSNIKTLSGWGWYLSNGVVDFLIGIIFLISPSISVELLPFFVGMWLIIKSSNGISFSIDIKEYGVRFWWWILPFSSLIGLLGFLIICYPVISISSPIMLTCWALTINGFILLGSALHIRKLHELPQRIVNRVTNSL